MEIKKTKRADLENKKGIFLQIGFIIVLALALGAFEWGTSKDYIPITSGTPTDTPPFVTPPITRPKPPPPPKKTTILKPVKKIEEEENEYKPKDVEADKNTVVEVIAPPEEKPVDEKIYDIVSDPPSFGNEGFQKYVYSKLKYPYQAIDNEIEGTVIVRFVVDQLGKVTNVQILRGVHHSIDNEARRVIENSPNWIPGEQMGRKVKVAYTMSVKFQLKN